MAVHAPGGVAYASDDSGTDSDDNVLLGVVSCGGGDAQTRGRSRDGLGFHAREARTSHWRGACVIRAPRDSDDSSDDASDGVLFGTPPLAKDPVQRTGNDTPASPLGAGGLHAVSRARGVSHQRVAARRAAARAAADRRKEALELELHWALNAEAEERAKVAATAKDIATQWVAAEALESAEAEREERAALDEMDARWKRDAAAVEAVLRADAAAVEAAAKAKAEAAAAAKAAQEAAAKAKLEAEEKEKRRLEAEAAAAASAASAAAVAEAKAKADAEAASKAADDTRRDNAGASGSGAGTRPGSVPKIQTSAEASAAEGRFAEVLREARQRVVEYASAASAKKERRLLNNQITVHVTQIAATKKQIEQKATDICQFLHSVQNEPQRTFALLSLSKRVLTQCDSQVSKLNRFAFALGDVCVRVAVFVPGFGQLLIALLHEQCVLAVPKYYPFVEGRYSRYVHKPQNPARLFLLVCHLRFELFITSCEGFLIIPIRRTHAIRPNTSGDCLSDSTRLPFILKTDFYFQNPSDYEYFKLMGYVNAEDQTEVASGAPPKLENTDFMCLRLRGFMLFYASYTTAEHGKHPHGLPYAWAWVSRLLNKIPPNRFSATALEAFLKHAGYSMNNAYGKQFHKLLQLIQTEFIPKLIEKDDPDTRPVVNRTVTFLNERTFLKSPEGRDMPLTDTSSSTRIS